MNSKSPNNDHDNHDDCNDRDDDIVIHIDRKKYKVKAGRLTGAQLRVLADPDIGPTYELWLDRPGSSDELIADDEVVKLRNGMHFFSAPANINPG